jgi:hypothetical protein
MTEKEAIKNLKEIIDLSKEEIENNDENTTAILDITDLKSLAIVLKALEEKDKIIDLMAKYFYDTDSLCVKDETEVNCNHHCVKCIKQYFQKKAREENE